jgi:hypothetical protein
MGAHFTGVRFTGVRFTGAVGNLCLGGGMERIRVRVRLGAW